MATEPGSGFQNMYFGSFLFALEASKSICGLPDLFTIDWICFIREHSLSGVFRLSRFFVSWNVVFAKYFSCIDPVSLSYCAYSVPCFFCYVLHVSDFVSPSPSSHIINTSAIAMELSHIILTCTCRFAT